MVAVEVYRSIDVSTHPELRDRLLAWEPAKEPGKQSDGRPGPEAAALALNTVPCPGAETLAVVPVPVLYHDPHRRLFILVLPEAARHRELEERAALLVALAAEPVDVPAYVREFAVVFGPAGLAARLAQRDAAAPPAAAAARPGAERTVGAAEEVGAEARQALAVHERALADRERALADRERALADRERVLIARERALDDRDRELDERERRLPERPSTRPAASPASDVTMIARVGEEAIEVLPEQLGEGGVIVADQIVSGSGRVILRPRRHGDDDTLMGNAQDAAVEHWLMSREPSLKLLDERGRPRIAVRAAPEASATLASEGLEVRVQLHTFPSGPLVVLALGTAASLAGRTGAPEPLPVLFDLDAPRDRAVLDALARDFTFTLELFGRDHSQVRRLTVTGELAGNVRYVLAAASAHASSIDRARRSFADSVLAFAAPTHDRYGWQHPERGEFREDKLTELATARSVRRALAIADRFSSPRREAYLFLLRGYPVHEWQTQRRAVLARAVELGLWMGPRLAQVAVSEGLARSRRELVRLLKQNFARLLAGSEANDLDADAISDNWSVLEKEAAALSSGTAPPVRPGSRSSSGPGVATGPGGPSSPPGGAKPASEPTMAIGLTGPQPKPRSEPVDSAKVSQVSGTIVEALASPTTAKLSAAGMAAASTQAGSEPVPTAAPAGHVPVTTPAPRPATILATGSATGPATTGSDGHGAASGRPADQLVAELGSGEPGRRVEAALALARLGQGRFLGPIMTAVELMSRSEASRVLAQVAASVPGAASALIRGLDSSREGVRLGSALALARLANEPAIEALSDALLAESGASWRELARALGRIGPPAILPLASRLARALARPGEAGQGPAQQHDGERDEQIRERVAWALAHIAARGGARQVEQLAVSRDSNGAEVARRAMELRDRVREDDQRPGLEPGAGSDDHTVHGALAQHLGRVADAPGQQKNRGDGQARGPDARAGQPSAELLDEADIVETTEASADPLDAGKQPPT